MQLMTKLATFIHKVFSETMRLLYNPVILSAKEDKHFPRQIAKVRGLVLQHCSHSPALAGEERLSFPR